MKQTVFEGVWQNPKSPFIIKNEEFGVGVVADAFPKFPDQVVIIPAEGFPERETASLCDLDSRTYFALCALQRVMQRKMESFSGIKGGVRGIARVDGYAVPNHPHIVMFPALRGESVDYTNPTRTQLTSPGVREHLIAQTVADLSLTARETDELDQMFARI